MSRVATVAGIVMLIGAVSAIAPIFPAKDDSPNILVLERHVMPGDTLWDLAEDVAEDGEDLRKIVYEIRKLNDLDSAVIYPGQMLMVPVEEVK